MIGRIVNNQGNVTDFVNVPYVFGENSILAHLNTNYYHVHGEAITYPDHADGVELTAGTGAWDETGVITEVIPEDQLTEAAYDLHFIDIYEISANGEIQIDVYSGNSGEEVLVCSPITQRTSNFSREGPQRIQIPQQPSGTRISCKLLDSTVGALTCKVKFSGHYYKG